jgi:hypothetical protein
MKALRDGDEYGNAGKLFYGKHVAAWVILKWKILPAVFPVSAGARNLYTAHCG